ncbi:hypothetical protein WEN_02430 [Mycoplasma wenyonii str. Massachusetts]|uniref:site-specific DNA-methyltransferase (adenine-specific) n=1 Tax=Mycoplasma wenyonii (strain Massachusetts) TaxID=1197325 RepID=I6Z6S3_MYCWM|nr:N-6 DNA methylase [Mycoplasma wenyonii]AFN65273.1 hypothetical protein WEN_02430 [Mycoplasma wenyonii str. Massachusetts]
MSSIFTTKQWFEKLMNFQGSLGIFEYGEIITSLFLLKHLDGRFKSQREKIKQEGREEELEESISYLSDGITYLPKEARWAEIREKSKEAHLGVCLDEAFELIQEEDPRLEGVIRRNCFTHSKLQKGNLNTLMDVVEGMYGAEESEERFIQKFQELLNEFAKKAGKVEKDYKHTELTASKLLVALLEPDRGRIYDPCFGTASLLLEAAKYIKKDQEHLDDVSFYGQELSEPMQKLAKINFAINGAELFSKEPACTFHNDQHLDLAGKVDYIVTSPPANQPDWRSEAGLIEDERWEKYGIPPANNANYAWVTHIIHKLSRNGIAALFFPQRSLYSLGDEKRIRQKIIEEDLVEAVILLPKRIVYNDDKQLSILVINNNKNRRTIKFQGQERTFRDRGGEVLFIDARKIAGIKVEGDLQLSLEDISKIVATFKSWRYEFSGSEMEDIEKIRHKRVTLQEIRETDYSLFLDKYLLYDSGEEKQDLSSLIEKKKEIERNLLILFETEEEKKRRVQEFLRRS